MKEDNISHQAKSNQDTSKNKPKLLSLFCGAGGLDIGFLENGYDIAFAADYDKQAITTYNNNHSGEKAHQIDLLVTSIEDLLQLISEKTENVQEFIGIIGGPPCQGFSRGNASRCHTDPRNQLAMKYAELVNYFCRVSNIKFFLFENVPEILANKNKEFLKLLREHLSIHFNIYEKELNASGFGVAQKRRRYFIVGIKKEIDSGGFMFPIPSQEKEKTVADVISDLPPPSFFDRKNIGQVNKFHPNHWTMQPKSKRFITGEMPEGGRSFIKLDWHKPSRTVAYGNREIHVHPDGNRRLSIYEAMQLQGFPKNYQLFGSLSAQVRQVSNAVPPPVAFALANSLNKYLKL